MIKQISYFVTGILSLSLLGCVEETRATEKIKIDSKYYPKGFETELQSNLDFFMDGVGVSPSVKVPYDHIILGSDGNTVANYTNITGVGFYLNLLTEMQRAGSSSAVLRMEEVLSVLESAPKWNGLFFWLYGFSENELTVSNDGKISAVDNGNLALSLAALSGAYYDSNNDRLKAIATRSESLLSAQKLGWSSLYDTNRGLLRAGWSKDTGTYLGYHIDRKTNESRLAVIWAVLSTEGSAQAVPASAFTTMPMPVGRYNHDGVYLEPLLSWDGSYFQTMMPSLWINEAKLMPDSRYLEAVNQLHKQYSDANNGIPFVSASATPNNGYHAYGIKEVSESYYKYQNSISSAAGTPHASALYYMSDPTDAVARLKAIKAGYPMIETKAGWRDAVAPDGTLSNKLIAIDQGMFVGAFIASSVQQDVSNYFERKGWKASLEQMYDTFVPTEYINYP
ncbi:hypothetical protein [Vibrio tapetis]|uniref:Putative membrane protein n=1 Tax=Vibrio tapetis subsp. tapetis TaxID=1671868 RepID=A0A2N8ZMS4_9VIBR|nr:hypothetical protein [Vibrio tapetis]SON53221.1 putative membrane protein [Vibrio tapetis subsp. tapetis]